MTIMAVDATQPNKGWREFKLAKSTRDAIIAAIAFFAVLGFFISIEFVEELFELTREHEDWELDEILASIPAAALVLAWFAYRRWREAKLLNIELAETNANLKATHERAIAAEAELRDAQRLDALGRLAGGLAHELNNMLQPVVTLTRLSLKNESLPGDIRPKLEQVLKASEHGTKIVSKALTFASGSSGDKEQVVFSDCVKDVVEFSATLLPPAVVVKADIADYAELAHINRTELTQVMTNLMTNAARAMDGRGSLEVGLSVEELEPDEAVSANMAPGRYFRLVVTDSGHGMTPDVTRRLFEPFYTTSETPDNAGLGLAVVHGLIRDWNGKISVQSEPGSGTTFTIVIPVTSA